MLTLENLAPITGSGSTRLSRNRLLSLTLLFDKCIVPDLTVEEQIMVNCGGFAWLCMANPAEFQHGKVIVLHPITTPECSKPETFTCIIDDFDPKDDGKLIYHRQDTNESFSLSRKDWGKYLVKRIC